MATVYITRAKTALVLTAQSFLAHLAKPRLGNGPEAAGPLSPRTIGLCLFVLSLAITAMFGALALPVMMLIGAGPSNQLQQVFARSIPSVVLAVIVLGPLIEEIMFRGWLSGTWRALSGSALFVAIVIGGGPIATRLAGGSTIIAQIGLAVIGLTSLWLLSPIDGGRRLPYFEQMFPYIFWAQGMMFGALHFQNVTASSSAIALLSTLPLVVCAWLWGYARLTIGLRGAILLHAAYNVPAVLGTIALTALLQA